MMNRKLIASLLVLCLAFSIGFAHAAPCKPATYSNVSPDTFQCMKTKLQNYGVSVPSGNGGELSSKGVSAHYLWDGKSTLVIKVTDKPALVSCETANKELIKFVDECQASKGKA
jgi:hypothetical protein